MCHPAPVDVTARFAAPLVCMSLLVLACAGGDDASDRDATTTSTAVPDTATSTTTSPPPTVTAPELTITGPIDGTPQTSAGDLAATGYVEEEYFVSGTARSFDAQGPLTDDGHWTLAERDTAPFTTRILVRRPIDPATASGVVVVEWNNVSAGFDTTPDWGYSSAELMRSGHTYIGVSAQKGGVDADDGGGLAGGFGAPLVTADPVRYASLSHPGDDYSYDLFRQIGAMARVGPASGVDPLEGLPRDHVIAAGESQSAFRLTAYVDGLQPLDPVFDGFLIHSRGGGSAAFDPSGDVSAATTGQVRIRDDLDVPVLVFSTETDLTLLGYAAARQPDTDRFRGWEVAGTAHADAFLLGGDPVAAGRALGCDGPVNDGPQHLALKAAVHHLLRWVVDGTPPPSGDPIELDPSGEIVRDADGNAVGGIRLPAVEVPVAALSGEPVGDNRLCRLFGATAPFAPGELTARYGSKDAYVAAYAEAYDRSVAAGFALAADRATALAKAAEVDFG